MSLFEITTEPPKKKTPYREGSITDQFRKAILAIKPGEFLKLKDLKHTQQIYRAGKHLGLRVKLCKDGVGWTVLLEPIDLKNTRQHGTRLNEKQAIEVVRMSKMRIQQKVIAKKFKVNPAVICDFLKGRTKRLKHLLPKPTHDPSRV